MTKTKTNKIPTKSKNKQANNQQQSPNKTKSVSSWNFKPRLRILGDTWKWSKSNFVTVSRTPPCFPHHLKTVLLRTKVVFITSIWNSQHEPLPQARLMHVRWPHGTESSNMTRLSSTPVKYEVFLGKYRGIISLELWHHSSLLCLALFDRSILRLTCVLVLFFFLHLPVGYMHFYFKIFY